MSNYLFFYTVSGTSQAERALQSMDRANHSRLIKLFNVAHSLAKKGKPYTDFSWFCETIDKIGTDIGQSYRTDKKCREFVHYIAEVERNKLKQRYHESDFVALVIDGSTDSSVTEQELLYLRTSKNGVVTTNYLSVCAVGKANAVNIHAAVREAVSRELDVTPEDFMNKIASLGTDGAAVMQGKRGGLVALMKELQPCLVGIHCMAHRLELAFKKTVKSFPVFAKIDQLLLDLYMFYHYSPLNRANLRTAYKTMPDLPALMPTRVGGTRWVGHLKTALDHGLRGYEAIVTHLVNTAESGSDSSHKTSATAKGLFKKLTNKDIFINSNFLLDVVNILSKLSLAFQSHTLTLDEVHIVVESSRSALRKMELKDGMRLRRVKDLNHFGGFPLEGTSTCLSATRKEFLNVLDTHLSARFEDIDSGLLSATSILNIKSWPKSKEELESFGDVHLEALVDHFGPMLSKAGFDCGSIETEWSFVKMGLHGKCLDELTWEVVSDGVGKDNPNFMALINLLLTLPATSAVCEQGFSQMKKIKNDWRSRLTNESLTNLMRVKIESPSVADYDPAPALQLWQCGGVRARRPGVKIYKARKPKAPESDSESDNSDEWSDSDSESES